MKRENWKSSQKDRTIEKGEIYTKAAVLTFELFRFFVSACADLRRKYCGTIILIQHVTRLGIQEHAASIGAKK